jgi:hypothetical protein
MQASQDKPSHHTGEIPICRYDDDGMRNRFFTGNAKMNLRFIHIVFVKAHSEDWQN